MRARLVREDVGRHLERDQALEQVDDVARHSDGARDPTFLPVERLVDRLVDVLDHHVEVARVEPLLDPRAIHVGAEEDACVHRRGQRLRATHAAQAAAHDEPVLQRPAEVPRGRRGERLVGALQDALRADVDPRAGRHLPEHDLVLGFELAEVLPRGPLPDQVRVGDEHARRLRRRLEHADGFSRLHEQRLVRFEAPQRRDDELEALPIARRLAAAAVHDEVRGILGHLGIEVVHQHAQRGFRRPRLARARSASRRALRTDRNGIRGNGIGRNGIGGVRARSEARRASGHRSRRLHGTSSLAQHA